MNQSMNHPMAQVEVEELEGAERAEEQRNFPIIIHCPKCYAQRGVAIPAPGTCPHYPIKAKRVRRYRESKHNRSCRERAKQIATALGVRIERFLTNGYVDFIEVRPPQGFVGSDPFADSHYARDWSEALSMVERYREVLAVPVRRALIETNSPYRLDGTTHVNADALLDVVRAYLPSNYTADLHLVPSERGNWQLLIEGRDSHGWTLDGYVLPRLASGLIFGREVKS